MPIGSKRTRVIRSSPWDTAGCEKCTDSPTPCYQIQPRSCVASSTEELCQLLQACGRHLPGACSGGIPGEVDDAGVDRLHRPSVGEGNANLVPRHPARPPITGLAVAETEHVITTTRWKYCGQALDVTRALVVIENVKEPAVEHRLELFAQSKEEKGVRHQESRRDAPLSRLRHGQFDGLCREVDSQDVVAE